MKSKKGFTLVELLAVIVILAVVMLMAVTAVGPLMTKSRKGALGSEGLELVNAAKTAFQTEQMGSGGKIKANSSVCFDLEWLKTNQYFEKGSAEGYKGSVFVKYDSTTSSYTYSFWIDNGTYRFTNVEVSKYAYDLATDSTADAINECNGATLTGAVKCTGTGACA